MNIVLFLLSEVYAEARESLFILYFSFLSAIYTFILFILRVIVNFLTGKYFSLIKINNNITKTTFLANVHTFENSILFISSRCF